MESICEYKKIFPGRGRECEEKKAGYNFGYLLMCVNLYETDVYWQMGQEEGVTALLH